MSEQAERIEKARRAYVAAIGTTQERELRRVFENVVADVSATSKRGTTRTA